MNKKDLINQAKFILTNGNRENNSDYIGSGDHCDAYYIRGNSTTYVLKYYHHKTNFTDCNDAEIHLKMYNMARGTKYVSQAITSSIKDRIIVTDFIGGKTIDKLEKCPINLPYLHSALRDFIKTYISLDKRGLKIDPNKKNIKLWNKKFYVVDFSKKADDVLIQNEILQIPLLLGNDLKCLIKIVKAFIVVLREFPNLKQKTVTLIMDRKLRIINYELNYGKLKRIAGINDDEHLINCYIHWLFLVDSMRNKLDK